MRALIPTIRFLLEQSHDHVGKRRRYRRIFDRRCDGDAQEMIAHDVERVAGAERRAAGRDLVERRAERIQVGALVDRTRRAAGLLGCDVGEGPDELVLRSEGRAFFGGATREMEIDEDRFHRPFDEEDVTGIDIAMDDAEPVDRIERFRQARREDELFSDVQLRAEDDGRERRSAIVPKRDRIGREFVSVTIGQRFRDAGNVGEDVEDLDFVARARLAAAAERLLHDHRSVRAGATEDARAIRHGEHDVADRRFLRAGRARPRFDHARPGRDRLLGRRHADAPRSRERAAPRAAVVRRPRRMRPSHARRRKRYPYGWIFGVATCRTLGQTLIDRSVTRARRTRARKRDVRHRNARRAAFARTPGAGGPRRIRAACGVAATTEPDTSR